MHIEFLIEDQSGAKAIEILLRKIFESNAAVTYNIHSYKGIGRIPKNLQPKNNANKRILLDQLPRLLRGYGKIPNFGFIVIICDLDDKNKKQFLSELNNVLNCATQNPTPAFVLLLKNLKLGILEILLLYGKHIQKQKIMY